MDKQAAAVIIPIFPDAVEHFRFQAENVAGIIDKYLTGICRIQTIVGSVKQGKTDSLLHITQMTGERRL